MIIMTASNLGGSGFYC